MGKLNECSGDKKVDIEAALYLKADEVKVPGGAEGCLIYISLVAFLQVNINSRFNVLRRLVTYHFLGQANRYCTTSCKELPLVG